MSTWHDLVDWAGDYPFKVAKQEEIFDFYFARGLSIVKHKTCGGPSGNNEFVFIKKYVTASSNENKTIGINRNPNI